MHPFSTKQLQLFKYVSKSIFEFHGQTLNLHLLFSKAEPFGWPDENNERLVGARVVSSVSTLIRLEHALKLIATKYNKPCPVQR